MRNINIILAIIVCCTLTLSCKEDKAAQAKVAKIQDIKRLLKNNEFEAARITAVDTLDPTIKDLYFEADEKLGHASHLDVRCNERIEEILYDIVKKVPAKNIKINRDLYSELVTLYPEKELYKKKFIYYDRKLRNLAAN